MATTVMPSDDVLYFETPTVASDLRYQEARTNLPPMGLSVGTTTAPNQVWEMPPSTFARFMETQREQFGHASFCGAHAQYILDADHTPRLVDGYTAIRWRAAGGSIDLGDTRWENGWDVSTRLDHYGGEFYTCVVAAGYDIHGVTMISRDPKRAMTNHRDAVTKVMQLANFHGLEASPSSDTQVLLESALA